MKCTGSGCGKLPVVVYEKNGRICVERMTVDELNGVVNARLLLKREKWIAKSEGCKACSVKT